MTIIDINADLGEGYDFDAALMPLISSCNIACGGHYGDAQSILVAIKLAMQHNVNVGAHPSYPDKNNFGRNKMSISLNNLNSSLSKQLHLMIDACKHLKVNLHHIKPHGALYNQAAIDRRTANVIIKSICKTGLTPILYAQQDSVLYEEAKNYLPVAAEAFIDRRYDDKLQLLSRKEENALIVNPKLAWDQFYLIIKEQLVQTISGKLKPITGQTFCIHGDNPQVMPLLKYIHTAMDSHNIKMQ